MTLPINVLQSIVARNRTTITGLHEEVVFWKVYVPNDPFLNFDTAFCYKQAAKYSKDIAKLAPVQRALKREISEQVVAERNRRAAEYRARWSAVGAEAAGVVPDWAKTVGEV